MSCFGITWMVATCAIFSLPVLESSLTSSTVKSYLTDLGSNYNKNIFPKYKNFGQVSVMMGLQLISINGFDEVSGILELVAKLKISWTDENLQRLYTPTYSSITEILVPQDDIWLPTITVYNSVESLKMVGDSSYHVRILPAIGWVQWIPGVITKTSCSVDATYFPFDKQTCDITFTNWGYHESEVHLFSRDQVLDLSLFTQNEQWSLAGSQISNSSKGGNSFITFSVTLERQPTWFLLNMVLPIILIGLLTGLVFLMPVDDGERVGYIITAFLTFAFFLDMISSNLPHTSNPMALVVYFLTVMVYLSSASTIVTIMTLRIYDKSTEVPRWLKIIVAIILARYCFPKKQVSDEEMAGWAAPEKKNKNKKPEVFAPTDNISYRLVGLALDILFFIVFVLVNLICTVVFIVPLSSNGS
ncbi:acetylcholine receptor subunit alpha-like [Saccostrea echinata]|uniref:acetylcholine receptor subunit alpha-like n=1 Tax=Saccostrea echinata TaxID=191078 RepID=UPI002A81ADFF|nr:acetylcholine receptor subunit alpha-like [Saccostrea echinata]